MDVTAKIAEFAVRLKYDQIPAPALEVAKKAVRDCIGVALAGSKEEDAKICAPGGRQGRVHRLWSTFEDVGHPCGFRQRHRGPRHGLRS